MLWTRVLEHRRVRSHWRPLKLHRQPPRHGDLLCIDWKGLCNRRSGHDRCPIRRQNEGRLGQNQGTGLALAHGVFGRTRSVERVRHRVCANDRSPTLLFQAIRFSLQSMSNVTFACTKFAISTLSAPLPPLRGSVVRLQNLFDPETHIQSTYSSVDMISQTTSRPSTGLII